MWMKVSALALFLASFGMTPAYAQPSQCDARDKVLNVLSQKYSEKTESIGVTNRGGLVEVLTNSSEGTWTIIVTTPKGISCLVAAGDGWRRVEQLAQAKDPAA